jgi:hypothetical protein
MARKQIITLNKVYKISMISTLILGLIIVISNQINQIAVMKLSALIYIAISLLFSISAFMLFLRHYKITSTHDILMRIIAIFGAVVCCSVWAVLIYPISMLLT